MLLTETKDAVDLLLAAPFRARACADATPICEIGAFNARLLMCDGSDASGGANATAAAGADGEGALAVMIVYQTGIVSFARFLRVLEKGHSGMRPL